MLGEVFVKPSAEVQHTVLFLQRSAHSVIVDYRCDSERLSALLVVHTKASVTERRDGLHSIPCFVFWSGKGGTEVFVLCFPLQTHCHWLLQIFRDHFFRQLATLIAVA